MKDKRFNKNRLRLHYLLVVCIIIITCGCNVVNTDKEMTHYVYEKPGQLLGFNQMISESKEDQDSIEDSILKQKIKNSTTETVQPSLQPTPEKKKVNKVTLLAVGDDLIHVQLIENAKQKDGSYNFNHMFEEIKTEVAEADIAVINQETIFAGKNVAYAGYPRFNSPKEVGDAVVNAGFDVVLHATNHALDKGEKGLENTIEYWKTKKKITVLGVNESKKEQDTVKIVEKNGIKIAMLNYTYSLNGLRLAKSKSYMVNMLEEKQIKKDIDRAKKIADFIIVYPHWGTEYSYEPSSLQKKWTKFFVEEEVDLVIGSHPHVLEPVEWLEAKNGHKTLVYYSLGNFISYQRKTPRMLGGMAKVTLEQEEGGEVRISEASITPLVTHFANNTKDSVITYRLEDYSKELAKEHKLANEDGLTLKRLKKLAKKVLGNWYE